jgi:putative copper resistance protein D
VIAAGLILSRLLHLSALMVLFGSGLFPLYAGANAKQDRRVVIIAARAALIGGVLWYLFTAAGMSGNLGDAMDWSVLSLVGGSTAFGHLWLARLALLVATLLLFVFGSKRWTWFAGVALSGIAVVTIPWAGHGQNGAESGSWIHAGGDAVHLLAAAIWIGALVRLLLLVRRGKSAEQGKIRKALIGFSAWGPATVALLLLSGLVNSWFLVGPQNLGAILRSTYGLTLVAKLILFAAMLGLATANRFRLTPRLALAGNPATVVAATQALNRSISAETLLAAAVLVAVAVMGTLPPPAS